MKVRFLSIGLFDGPVVMSEVGSDLIEFGNAFHDKVPELEIMQRRPFLLDSNEKKDEFRASFLQNANFQVPSKTLTL